MNNNIQNMNKKPSITLFFCDIYGTVDGGCSEEECQRFAKILKELKEKTIVIYYYLECFQQNIQI